MNQNKLLQPALIGGLVMGVLSALPIVYIGNCCCCLWVVSGGLVAAYVLQQNQAGPVTPGDAALAGLLAGLFGAFVHLVLSIPIGILMAPLDRAMMQRVIDMAGSMQPEMRDTLERLATQRAEMGAAGFVLQKISGFVFMLCVGAVFSTLGGLLGVVFFKKAAPSDPTQN